MSGESLSLSVSISFCELCWLYSKSTEELYKKTETQT